MRKRHAIAAMVLLATCAAAPPARAAGLDLAMNGCPTDAGVSELTLSCDNPSSLAFLIGSFQLPTAVNGMVSVDISLDFEVEAAALPNFWQFDACNATGMSLSLATPLAGCTGVGSPWGTDGSGGDETRAYLSAFGGRPTRGRLIAFLSRIGGVPVNVPAGTDMFAFSLQISTVNASEAGGACEGCATPTVVVWNSAEFRYFSGGQPQSLLVSNPGAIGHCVRLNGAAAGTCAATPARATTWGRIKTLYR